MLIRNQSYHILLQILFLSSLIRSESRISELNIIQINNGENILPFNENRLLTWDKNKVNLGDMIVYRETEGQVINVILNSNNTNPIAAIVISNLNQENNFLIQLLDIDGRINALKPMNKPFDVGLPIIHFMNTGLLLMKPEEQEIQVYDFDGSKSGEFSLFKEKSWSHEKRILTASGIHDKLYLLGMKSADLKNSQNVSLFNMDGEPKLIIDLPITIPYFFSISNEDISVIIGTKNISDKYQQKPYLFFLDHNHNVIDPPIGLKKLPRKTIWFEDKLFLIYRDHLLIYSAHEQSPPQRIKFKSKIHPIDAFTNDKSIFIISGNGIGVGQNGNFYHSIDLVEYNQTTQSVGTQFLRKGPIRNVEYFPTYDEDSFYLRLDNQLIQFLISR